MSYSGHSNIIYLPKVLYISCIYLHMVSTSGVVEVLQEMHFFLTMTKTLFLLSLLLPQIVCVMVCTDRNAALHFYILTITKSIKSILLIVNVNQVTVNP